MTVTLQYHIASSSQEEWLLVHLRRLFVHVFHSHTLCVNGDGRLAVATGPFLIILHPPPVPPFRPTPHPPLRLVHTDDINISANRKDTLTTTSHITSITWTHHALLFLCGSSSLSLLQPPAQPNTLNFSHDKTSHLWNPLLLSLPHHSPKTKIECFAYTRLCSSAHQCHSSEPFVFYPFLIYGADDLVHLFSISSFTQPHLSTSPVLDVPPFLIHSRCPTALACNEGVQTESGFVTVVAVADSSLNIVVYTLALKFVNDIPFISSKKVWSSPSSIPPGPVISLSLSLHSTRDSLLTMAVAMGNDVIVVDWMSNASNSTFNPDIWSTPQIHSVRDAHDHVVTAVHVCHDGSVVSAGMDGRVICWRVNPVRLEATSGTFDCEITAAVLQERLDGNEPIMALERTSNAFALVTLASTSRQGQETCDSEVMRKNSGTQRRTALRIITIPPYGTPDNVEMAIMSCVDRLMTLPSFIDQPLTFWDVSHFLHSFSECSSAVIPKLRTRLAEMTQSLENNVEKSAQRFAQRCRVLLWLARVIDHPDGVEQETRDAVKEYSRRFRNSLLFIAYVESLQQFLKTRSTISEYSHMERVSLENMCQFVSTWRVSGLDVVDAGLQAVRDVRSWLEPFVVGGETLTSYCVMCSCGGSEAILVADGVDPGTVWCTAGHSFSRCVISALPVADAVSLECAGCQSRACCLSEEEFSWIYRGGICSLCNGGLVNSHCQAG